VRRICGAAVLETNDSPALFVDRCGVCQIEVGQLQPTLFVYVLLASDEGSYIPAARVAVTGGRPVL